MRFAKLVYSSVLVLILCSISSVHSIGCPITGTNNGTTLNFEQIFLGRCFYFIHVLHATDCDIQAMNISCTELYNQFAAAVLDKDPCDIKMEDFNRFLDLAEHPIGVNLTMFWSGTYTPAHEFSKNRNYWSLEDTLSGYLLNELVACSSAGSASFSSTCQDSCVRTDNPFWNAASSNFASKARGYVISVLNGTRTSGAVYNQSTFFRFELPQMSSENVKQLKVLLVHNPGMKKYETCGMPKTLNILKEKLVEKNIEYMCEDNPVDIAYFLCFQDPTSKECHTIKHLLNSARPNRVSKFMIFTFSIFYLWDFVGLKKFIFK